MSIKFDIHRIENSCGTGAARIFARPQLHDALTLAQLEERICHSCTLTASDIRSVLAALTEVMQAELSAGSRVHLPGIGYFAPKVGLNVPENPSGVKGNHLYTASIRFRPEAALLHRVRRDTHFERMEGSSRSRQYTPDEMGQKVRSYLHDHHFVTRRVMEEEFGLRKTMAQRWLARLVAQGLLARKGAKNSPVYTAAPTP